MDSVLITGAGRGLGLEFARQYASDGWQVYACCRNPAEASDLQTLSTAPGVKLSVHKMDTTDQASIKAVADELLSTGQMLDFVRTSSAPCFIIATEVGIIHALKKENSRATYIPGSEQAYCENMKKITLEKVLWSLEDMTYEVTVPQDIAVAAKRSLDRMISVLPTK